MQSPCVLLGKKRLGPRGPAQYAAIDPFHPRHCYDEASLFAVKRAGLTDYLDLLPESFQNLSCASLLNKDGLLVLRFHRTFIAKVMDFIRGNFAAALRESCREMPAQQVQDLSEATAYRD